MKYLVAAIFMSCPCANQPMRGLGFDVNRRVHEYGLIQYARANQIAVIDTQSRISKKWVCSQAP